MQRHILGTLLACAALFAHADEAISLPGGSRLVLDDKSLRLVDAAGQERARHTVRGKHLDLRGNVATVLDSDTQHSLLWSVDAAQGRLERTGQLPPPEFGVEAACLFQDRQGLLHLFRVAADGQAEQWLLHGAQPQRVRRLALPPDVEQCWADDAHHRLYVHEEGFGVWAYEADAEAPPARQLALQGKAGKKRLQALKAAAAAEPPPPALPVVQPRVQTDPVARFGDAADDPAIWVHPSDASLSRVLGTNKKQGLLVYDLQGHQRQLLEAGRLNNVDVRQQVRFGERRIDLAAATRRDDNTLALFAIAADGTVSEQARIATDLDEIYGMCLHAPRAGGLEAFVNDKDGRWLRVRIALDGDALSGSVVQRFALRSQPEACVADDARERLFMGEERRGVWAMALAPGARNTAPAMVLPVGGPLKADVEGLALVEGAAGPYLVVSSQGDNSYVVADALPPYRLRGAFRIGFNVEAGIDGASQTDGLEATSRALGPGFEQGLLVVQDGFKRLPDGPQNFKYVPWADVARVLRLP